MSDTLTWILCIALGLVGIWILWVLAQLAMFIAFSKSMAKALTRPGFLDGPAFPVVKRPRVEFRGTVPAGTGRFA